MADRSLLARTFELCDETAYPYRSAYSEDIHHLQLIVDDERSEQDTLGKDVDEGALADQFFMVAMSMVR